MRITFQAPKINIDQTWIKRLNFPKIAQEEAANTRAQIIQNLNAGAQADGSSMRAYSPGYARLKGSSTPNLLVTGELHRSFVVRALPDGAEVVFHGQHAPSKPLGSAGSAHAHSKKKQGAPTSARSASSAKRAGRPRVIGGNAVSAKSSGSSGGQSISNAALASSLYARGFTGWVSFSPKRIKEISERVSKEIVKILKTVVVTK